MSQQEMILDYLLDGKRLTAKKAMDLFGCFGLADRINDLNRNLVVQRRQKPVKNRYGKVIYVTEYWI